MVFMETGAIFSRAGLLKVKVYSTTLINFFHFLQTILVNSVMPFFIFLSGYTVIIICIDFFEEVSKILTLNVITDHYEADN